MSKVNPDCDCAVEVDFCLACQQEALERGIESAMLRAEEDHDKQEAEDLR